MSEPLLSIVIANYNYGRYLEKAIRSVVDQDTGGKVELIVCDAGSTDDSVDIIKKYEDRIAWWCSETDRGQSDAFNKGFSHAKGKYLAWLNADDIMIRGSLVKVVEAMEQHPECEWFTGNMFRFTEDGKVVECPWGPHSLPGILQSKGQPTAVYGPSTFFSKKLFERVGGMKVYQNFMMDTDLWMRFIVEGIKQRRINYYCWAFRMHEQSKTAEYGDHKLSTEQRRQFEEERQRAYRETGYHTSKINHLAIRLWRILDGSFLRHIWIRLTFKEFHV